MIIRNNALTDSASISSSIYDSFYPNGRRIVLKTSYAEDEGSYSRTLSSRSASDILSGDALYRNPRFSHSFLIRQLDSSLNSLITGGAEAVHNSPSLLEIDNPESSSFELTTNDDGTESYTKTMISGGAAFNRLVAETIVGKKGGSNFIDSTVRLALAEMSNTQNSNPDYIAGLAHGNNEYGVIGTTVTTGSRTVVLASGITIEEKNWLLERANLLKSYSTVEDHAYLTSGFSFDIPNGLTNLNQTQTFYPSLQAGNVVEQYLVDAPSSTAYICPSVIELLIFLQSKMEYRCRLGVNVSTSAQSTTNTTLTSNGSVNDHVFGRAFDITYVASKPPATSTVAVDLITQGTDLSKYRSALDHFLTVLSAAPNGLLPDLIVIHGDLMAEMGIVSGNETTDAAIKKKYPKFANVNFQADANHKTNIHVSFSAQRSGQYTGPGGTLGVVGTFLVPITGSPDAALSSVPQAASPVLGEKFTKSYANSTSESLTRLDVFNLLRGTVLSDEAAAIMTAVVIRESNARPAAFNPKVTLIRSEANSNDDFSGDWSVGLFQSNLLVRAHGTKVMSLPVGTTIANNRKTGWNLGYKNATAEGINEANFNQKMYNKYKSLIDAGKTHNQAVTSLFPSVDPSVWIPFNQAFMLYSVVTPNPAPIPFLTSQRLGLTAESGYVFQPWGDYGGGPEKGFITGVNFKDAIEVYESIGKDRVLLKRWTLTMFNGSPGARSSRAYPYSSNWVNGWVYPYSGAPVPPEEELYPNAPGLPSGGPGGTGTDTGGSAYRFPGLSPALTSAMVWSESQIGAPYAAVHTYRFGIPWPALPNGDGASLVSFRNNPDGTPKYYTFPPGTLAYDCSGFVIALYRRVGIDFVSQYGITYSQAFNTDNLPDAPAGNYRAGDIAVYAPDLAGVGHVVVVHSKNSDGTYKTIEAAGGSTGGVQYKTLRQERTTAVKRPLP